MHRKPPGKLTALHDSLLESVQETNIKPKCGKMPYFAVLKSTFKFFWIRVRRWVTSKITSSLATSVVEFS